jgi:hypothetical protein
MAKKKADNADVTSAEATSGTPIPPPNAAQLVDEVPESSGSADSLDPALVDPEKAAIERVEGRTSDAATRVEGTDMENVEPDLAEQEKPSDAGAEQYPFPPAGDVEVATVEAGDGGDEYMAPLEVEDWVILGEHELVPPRLEGRRAVVVNAPKFHVAWSEKDNVWITVKTRDEVNATLHIPLAAVKEIQKGGLAVTHRG